MDEKSLRVNLESINHFDLTVVKGSSHRRKTKLDWEPNANIGASKLANIRYSDRRELSVVRHQEYIFQKTIEKG